MKKNWIKIALDIAMAFVFVLLFNKAAVAGLQFHEIAGLAIGVVFIIHMTLNRTWIAKVTKQLFGNKVNIKTKIGYIVDSLLLICMIIIIVSGISISKILLPNNILSGAMSQTLHISAAYLTLILLGIHIGLHWSWVMNMFKKAIGMKQSKKVLKYAAEIIVIIVFALGIYNMVQVNYFTKVSLLTSSASSSTSEQMHSAAGENQGGRTQSGASTSNQGNNIQNGNSVQGNPGHPIPSAGSVNIFQILYQFISILSVPTIITYYLEKFLTGTSRKVKALPQV